jgi:hypothetical protein
VQSWNAQVQFTFAEQTEANFCFIVCMYIYIYMCVCVCVCVCENYQLRKSRWLPACLIASLFCMIFSLYGSAYRWILRIYMHWHFIFLFASCFLCACRRKSKVTPIPSQFLACILLCVYLEWKQHDIYFLYILKFFMSFLRAGGKI